MAVLYASISVLNWMRAATGSQCRDKKRGVTWALLGSLKTNRAAALYMELFEVRVLVLYQFFPITSNRLLWRPVSNNHIWVTRQHTVLCFIN